MVIYKTDNITILYYEADQMIETIWHSFASSQDYRQALEQYIEAIRKYEVKRWLGDYRHSRVVRPVDQRWTVEVWAPQFFSLTNGLEKMARVKSHDVAAQISSDTIRQNLDPRSLPFRLMEFENYGKARAWLLN